MDFSSWSPLLCHVVFKSMVPAQSLRVLVDGGGLPAFWGWRSSRNMYIYFVEGRRRREQRGERAWRRMRTFFVCSQRGDGVQEC